MDAHKNLAYTTVATAPSPAGSGTSLVVTAGTGSRFPAVPFNATIWAVDEMPDPTNAEIVRVTNISSDTLTITRAQEGTSARTVVVGDQIAASITALTLTDIEDLASTALSVANAASTRASVVSQALSVETAARLAGDNALSQAVSVLSQTVSAADAALSARIDGVGAGSVTSDEVSVLRASVETLSAKVVSVSAQVVSVEAHAAAASAAATSADSHAATASAAATSADGHANAVSAALAVLSLAVSLLSTNVSTLSAKVVSVSAQIVSVESHVDAVSQAHSALSQTVSVADAALSARITSVGGLAGGGSVTSDEASAISAQAASADAALSARITSVGEQAGGGSVTSNELSAVSAAVTSVDTHAAAASAAATSADGHANAVSAAKEVLSAKVVSISAQLVSIEARVSAVSALTGGGASVTSTEFVDLTSAHNALSNVVSAIPGAGSVNAVALITNETGNTVSSTSLVTVSGLSVSVSAGGVYKLEAIVMHTQSVAGGVGYGMSWPTMNAAVCQVFGGSVGPAMVGTVLSTHRQWGIFNQDASGSLIFSVSATNTQNVPAMFEGVFNVQTGGVIHMLARVSVGTLLLVNRAGSYMRVFRLN